jgi:spore coat polysaccharide biosynthesis predicted glycosyltransferase SpsG
LKWGLRVATDPRFGAGHWARCAALAARLEGTVTLFCDPDPGLDVVNVFRSQERIEEPAVNKMNLAVEALGRHRVNALIVDSYSIEQRAIAKAAEFGFVAAFRDATPQGAETVSINPNPGSRGSAKCLAGPAYMPLAGEFERQNIKVRAGQPENKRLKRVLIAFGARDSVNRTLTALQGIAKLGNHVEAGVLLGRNATHAETVRAAVNEMSNVEMVPSSAGVCTLYAQFDIAIGAPGVSQFERACCGLPSVLVAQNDEHNVLCHGWAETGAAVECEADANSVAKMVSSLLNAPDRVGDMRARGLALVDGKGAARLAADLSKLAG